MKSKTSLQPSTTGTKTGRLECRSQLRERVEIALPVALYPAASCWLVKKFIKRFKCSSNYFANPAEKFFGRWTYRLNKTGALYLQTKSTPFYDFWGCLQQKRL